MNVKVTRATIFFSLMKVKAIFWWQWKLPGRQSSVCCLPSTLQRRSSFPLCMQVTFCNRWFVRMHLYRTKVYIFGPDNAYLICKYVPWISFFRNTYAHLNFHYPQHQDRPRRVNVRQNRQDFLVLCIFLPDNISLIPRYLGFQVLFWYFAPDTWSLPFLTWYLICMTLSSLQVSINDGGWEHCRSAPPLVLKCIGRN